MSAQRNAIDKKKMQCDGHPLYGPLQYDAVFETEQHSVIGYQELIMEN